MNDLDELARLAGADATSFTGHPAHALPLLRRLEGNKGYKSQLKTAAKDLHRMLHLANPESLPKWPKPSQLEALQYLLHSLAHVASRPVSPDGSRLRYVAISRRAEDFTAKGEYGFLSRTAFRAVVDALKSYDPENTGHPWLLMVDAYHNRETGKGRRTRIQARRSFLDWMVQHGLIFPWHPHGTTAAKAQSKASIALLWVSSRKDHGEQEEAADATPLNRPLQGDEKVLPALHAALDKQRLRCPLDTYAEYEQLFDFARGRPKHSLGGDRQLYRQFAEEDGRAGRLYGHWVQPLPKWLRKKLTIDGKPTVELDYASMQLVLLYGLKGLPVPEGEDLYAFPGMPATASRSDMKLVLTRSVGNPTKEATVASIQHAWRLEGRSKVSHAEALYDSFWSHHAAVCPHSPGISDAAWPQLQHLDSQIALRVLRKLLDQGITAIPIHDSFVVQERHADATEQVMQDAFAELCPGVPIRVKRT